MRLSLLIRDLGYAGAQRQLVALAKGVQQAGHEVAVLCFYGGPLQAELESSGVQVVCLGKRHRWDMLSFFWRLIRSVRASRPDVLYSFLNEANLVAALMKPLLPRTRIVWGMRDSETDAALHGWLGKLVFRLSKVLSKWPDLLIANSHSGARYYAAQGYPKDRIVVVPNGIDTERFRPDRDAGQRVRAELGITPDLLLFGIVGRLSPMKDYATFLRAAAQVPNACFLCVGGGSDAYATEMRALADELGLSSRVFWSAPRGDMPTVFNALDALVSSSAFGEGFSNVVGEAMACSTPCIVTDVGDSAVLVGDTGFGVPSKNVDALAAAMNRLALLPSEEKQALSRRARDRIEQQFTVDSMVQRTLTHLNPSSLIPHPSLSKPLFIITALGTGGAEMMLTQLITHLDRTRFAPEVISLMAGGKHEDALRSAGIPVHTLNLEAGRPSLRALWRLRSLVKQIKPDTLVGWMYHGNLAATLASWIGVRVPVIWNVRQSLYSLALEKRGSAMVIKLLARLGFNPRAVLYNSQISAHQHEAIGYPADKTILVPNGFDCDRFAPDAAARVSVRAELGLAPDALLVGRFGRHSAMKDYPTFIAAAELVAKQMPNVHFTIAGTGTEEIRGQPSLHVLGERLDLPRLTAALDVACSSSAFGEGFPNVVAEAMSCGVPCVVTDVGDSAWLLRDAGTVVAANDAPALADGLLSILRSDQRAEIGRKGRQRIVDDFALPSVVRQFESLLVPMHPSFLIPHPFPPCVA